MAFGEVVFNATDTLDETVLSQNPWQQSRFEEGRGRPCSIWEASSYQLGSMEGCQEAYLRSEPHLAGGTHKLFFCWESSGDGCSEGVLWLGVQVGMTNPPFILQHLEAIAQVFHPYRLSEFVAFKGVRIGSVNWKCSLV